jgi:hypothetical protein
MNSRRKLRLTGANISDNPDRAAPPAAAARRGKKFI